MCCRYPDLPRHHQFNSGAQRQHRGKDGRIYATFEALYAQAWYKEAGYEFSDNMIPIRAAGDIHPGGV